MKLLEWLGIGQREDVAAERIAAVKREYGRAEAAKSRDEALIKMMEENVRLLKEGVRQ